MSEISKNTEMKEVSAPKVENYKEIKSESDISTKDAKDFWDGCFETDETDVSESDLEKTVGEYIEDLKEKSECSETIPDKPLEASDLKKRSPEENAEMREEFAEKKAELKKEWEEANGMPWPKYEHDVYSASGKLIRKAGSDYDAHHILPLGMGGKNEVGNITPLHAEVHYDKQGVHASDSPYSKLDQKLGDM